ncbi:hypothetical protein CNMCM5793_006737 [Aspergillus hiratsukae]|uniref:Uncharacterized protein n=1 Tax=Aspergillus hiratsukae TaxID=1194566 RepID=A0A8H6QH57_9EURO|nr:hypothetical protein CNMCM5793_006737 [Aspergillus hiratsukae]KAF7173550.1 hypothetical protein CNMCM6106_007623 [Aspergillus hiratsukae]
MQHGNRRAPRRPYGILAIGRRGRFSSTMAPQRRSVVSVRVVDPVKARKTAPCAYKRGCWDMKEIMASNLVVIEAKNEKTLGEAKAQLLCYMGIQPPHFPFCIITYIRQIVRSVIHLSPTTSIDTTALQVSLMQSEEFTLQWDNKDQESSDTTLALLCCAFIALLSLPGGIQLGRIKGENRWPPVEPFARTLVSLMLIDAICEQAGYNWDDEDEARDIKNWDIVFLDRVDGVARILNGKVDSAIWDLKLGAFKSALPPYQGYKKAPDFVLKNQAHMAKVVGEAKVPWIPEHHLRDQVRVFDVGELKVLWVDEPVSEDAYDDEGHLQVLLAQLIQYMQD